MGCFFNMLMLKNGRYHCLLLVPALAFSSPLLALPTPIPEDIAYQHRRESPRDNSAEVIVGTATLPASSNHYDAHEAAENPCLAQSNSVNLHKSLVIAQFLRTVPHQANGGNLFAAEVGVPTLIRAQLADKHQRISPAVLPFGFSAPDLTDAQLQQQAQKLGRQWQSQFVLSGTIDDMGMASPEANYNPNLYRRVANTFHDTTKIKSFDKRVRRFNLSVQLRDGFTGELLFTKHYSTSGVWNEHRPVGFDSPAFYKTHYGKNIAALAQSISQEVASVIQCQPFMARIDSHAGQSQILLHGGANNGLHAGDTLSVYQLMVVGSNNEYQANETRLIKREARLHLREVYPSHSIAQVEGEAYLNGHYLAVSE